MDHEELRALLPPDQARALVNEIKAQGMDRKAAREHVRMRLYLLRGAKRAAEEGEPGPSVGNFVSNIGRIGKEHLGSLAEAATDFSPAGLAKKAAYAVFPPLKAAKTLFAPETEAERLVAEPIQRGLGQFALPGQMVGGAVRGLAEPAEATGEAGIGERLVGAAKGFVDPLWESFVKPAIGGAPGEMGERFVAKGRESLPEWTARRYREMGASPEVADVIGKTASFAGDLLFFPGAPRDIAKFATWLPKMLRNEKKAAEIARFMAGRGAITAEEMGITAALRTRRTEEVLKALREAEMPVSSRIRAAEIPAAELEIPPIPKMSAEEAARLAEVPPEPGTFTPWARPTAEPAIPPVPGEFAILPPRVERAVDLPEVPGVGEMLPPRVRQRPVSEVFVEPRGLEPPTEVPVKPPISMTKPGATLAEVETAVEEMKAATQRAALERPGPYKTVWEQGFQGTMARRIEPPKAATLKLMDELTAIRPNHRLAQDDNGFSIMVRTPSGQEFAAFRGGTAEEAVRKFADNTFDPKLEEWRRNALGALGHPAIPNVPGALERRAPQDIAPALKVTRGIPPPEGKIGNPHDFRRALEDLTNAVVRKGGIKDPEVLGFYRTFAKDINVRKMGDFGTVAHEIAHRIDDLLFDPVRPTLGVLSMKAGAALGAGSPLTRYQAELTGLASPGVPLREGFAEFVRLWLTNAAQAKLRAPRMTADFGKLLLERDPGLAQGLAKLQAEVSRFTSASEAERLGAYIVSHSKNPKPPGMDSIEAVRFGLYDDTLPLRRSIDDAVAAGATKPPPEWDPVEAIMTLRNSPAQIERWFFEGVPNALEPTKNAGPALRSAYDAAGGQHEALGQYEIARRLSDAFDSAQAADKPYTLPNMGGPSGASQADLYSFYRRIVDTAPDAVKAAKEGPIRDFDRAAIRWIGDEGFFDAGDIARMEGRGLYAPMSRLVEGGAGHAGKTPGMFKKAALESDLEVLDPLVQRGKNVAATIRMAHENRVVLSLSRFALNNPGVAKIVRIPPGQIVEHTIGEALAGIAKAAGMTLEDYARTVGMSADDLARVYGRFVGKYKGPKGETYRRGMNKIGPSGRRPLPELDADEVWIEVSSDAEEALASSLDMPDGNLVTNLLAKAADIFRTGVVQTLPFAATAGPIDILMSQIASRTQKVPLVDAIYNWARGLKSTWTSDEFYRAARDAGALWGTKEGVDVRNVAKMERELLGSRNKSIPRKIAEFVFGESSRLEESATRVGEVRRMIERRGWDPRKLNRAQLAELGQAGREVAVNFRRHGAYTAAARKASPFWNAWIQGNVDFVRGVARNPAQASVMMLGSVVPISAYLWYANHDQDWYRALPEEERRDYWHFGPRFKMRKPFQLGVIGTFVERVFDGLSDARPNVMEEMGDLAFGLLDGAVPFVSNPLIKGPAEAWTKKKLDRPMEVLRGKAAADVIPRQLQGGEPGGQAYPDVGGFSGRIGEIANVSPIMMQRQVRTFTGTVGAEALKALDALWPGRVAAPTKETADYPLVGRFAQRGAPTRTSWSDRFYDLWQRAETVDREIKRREAQGRSEDAASYRNENVEHVRRYDILKRAKKAIDATRREIDAVRAHRTMSGDEKRRRIDDLNRRLAKQYERAVK